MLVCLAATPSAPARDAKQGSLQVGEPPSREGRASVSDDQMDLQGTCVGMTNYWNSQYTSMILTGSPGQEQEVVPDTGSFALVLDSALCTSEGCKAHNQFLPETSANFVPGPSGGEFQIEYGQGGVFVREAQDTVQLGSVSHSNISLLLMVNETLDFFKEAAFEGVMGLGHNPLAETGGAALLSEFGVRTFGICLGQGDGAEGRLDLSQEIPALAGKYNQTLDVIGKVHWGVGLSGVSVGGVPLLQAGRETARPLAPNEPFSSANTKDTRDLQEPHGAAAEPLASGAATQHQSLHAAAGAAAAAPRADNVTVCGDKHGCAAILDSGTSLLTVPEVTLDALYDTIGLPDLYSLAEQGSCHGALYEKLPNVTFTLSGVGVTLQPADYMAAMEVDAQSVSGSFHAHDGASAQDGASPAAAPPFSYKLLAQAQGRNASAASSSSPLIRCIPLFGTLDSDTDHGPLYILGMPLFRAFAAKFDRTGKTIKLATVRERSTCNGCGVTTASKEAALATALAAGAARTPVRVRSSKLRLPWWAVRPELRPAQGGGEGRAEHAAAEKTAALLQGGAPREPWILPL